MGQRPLTGKILPGIARVAGVSTPWFTFEHTAKDENNELEMLENELMEEMKYFEKTHGQHLQPAGTFGTDDDVVDEGDDEEEEDDEDEDNNEEGGGNSSREDGEIVDEEDVGDERDSSGSDAQTPSPPPAPVARVVTRSVSVGRRGRGLAGMPRRGSHH